MGLYQWVGGDDNGVFGEASNWINVDGTPPMPGVPGTADVAIVNGSGFPITGSGTVAQLVLSGNGGTLTTTGLSVTAPQVLLTGTVALTNSTGFAAQQVQVTGGTTTASGGSFLGIDDTSEGPNTVGLDVGQTSGETGALNLTGFDTEAYVIAGNTVVGDAGTGAVTISAGATLGTNDIDDQDTVVPGSGYVFLGNAAGSQGTLTVTGLYSSLQAEQSIDVGKQGIGRLTIAAGAEASIRATQTYAYAYDLVVGDQSSGNGAVLVTGAGSRLMANTDVTSFIGLDGTGALTVASGALVELGSLEVDVFNAKGSITVAGAGSLLELLGYVYLGESGGTGTLSVTSGALVVDAADANFILGYDSTGSGTVSVSGAGSTLNTGNTQVFVGLHGAGKMTIGAGGTVLSGAVAAALGEGAGSAGTVTINGAGARWVASGEITIGYDGEGSLLIEAGGAVTSGDGTNGFVVGHAAGGVGTAEVTGVGSHITNSGSFVVSDGGAGSLSVLAGATVSTTLGSGGASDGAVIGEVAGGSGKVTVSGAGSTWSIASDLVVGDAGTGSLVIGSGGKVTAGSLETSVTGAGTITLSGTGTTVQISGSAVLGGDAITSVSIGTGSVLAIAGSALLAGAKIAMAGGKLTVGKTLTLNGGQTITGSGTVQAGSIINAGTVTSSAGALSFIGGISGTGTFDIGSDSTLSLSAGVGAGGTVAFKAATGTLSLGTPARFLAEIAGFVKGDIIDLTGTLAKSLTISGHTLSVHETSGASLGLLFEGTYSTASFAQPTSDGHGGTLITHA